MSRDGHATWGCRRCLPARLAKVYTGRKFWREDQYATPEQIREANYNFETRVKRQVADQYRRMRPSRRVAMFGA